MVKASHGPGGETSTTISMPAYETGEQDNQQVAPQLAADASMVGLSQLLIVSRTCSSSSPRVVKPVTLREWMTDLPVLGSTTPGKMAPPWQLHE
jgi:hypothetical protein